MNLKKHPIMFLFPFTNITHSVRYREYLMIVYTLSNYNIYYTIKLIYLKVSMKYL